MRSRRRNRYIGIDARRSYCNYTLQDPQLTEREGISVFYKDLLSSRAPVI